MTTMAEVIATHRNQTSAMDEHPKCRCGWVGSSHDPHVEAELTKAGFGHVPTALNEAADATPISWDFGPGVSAVQIRPWLRKRASNAGGGHE